ncbi:MAG: hypothetical protein ABEJ40_03525 [Haloarculaceae archaeon]
MSDVPTDAPESTDDRLAGGSADDRLEGGDTDDRSNGSSSAGGPGFEPDGSSENRRLPAWLDSYATAGLSGLVAGYRRLQSGGRTHGDRVDAAS